MKAGWLSRSPVPFKTLVGEWVWALTRPGTSSRSRASMACTPAVDAVPASTTAEMRPSRMTTSARSGPRSGSASTSAFLITRSVTFALSVRCVHCSGQPPCLGSALHLHNETDSMPDQSLPAGTTLLIESGRALLPDADWQDPPTVDI